MWVREEVKLNILRVTISFGSDLEGKVSKVRIPPISMALPCFQHGYFTLILYICHLLLNVSNKHGRMRLKCDGTRAETRFRLSAKRTSPFNPLNPELNTICHFLALLGAHHFLHVSRIRVKLLTFRLLMSYIYIYIYIEHLFLIFLDHTQRRSTVGRTPLDE
jgi:hypothetical protein